ncbi:hypothetical protein [Viscerimonas tarda]
MIVISSTDLRINQKKYLDLAEKEQVVIKRGRKLIELVVKERLITDEDLRTGITGEELKERMHRRIDKIFDK